MSNLRIAVYTAVFDCYDIVLPPICVSPGVDFYCFTNNSFGIESPWKVVLVKKDKSQSTKVQTAYLKIKGHKLLNSYDVTVWTDANIFILGDILQLVKECRIRSLFCVNKHLSRSCVYAEADHCIAIGKADSNITLSQISKYRSEGFPRNFGLSETTVLVRDNFNEKIQVLENIWWDEFINGGHRDQLSLDYARWRTNCRFSELPHDYRGLSGFFYKYPHVPLFIRSSRFLLSIWIFFCKSYFSNYYILRVISKIFVSTISRYNYFRFSK